MHVKTDIWQKLIFIEFVLGFYRSTSSKISHVASTNFEYESFHKYELRTSILCTPKKVFKQNCIIWQKSDIHWVCATAPKFCRWPAQTLDCTYMSIEHQLYTSRKKFSNKNRTSSEFLFGHYGSTNSKFLYAASINSKFHHFDFSEFVFGPYGSTNSTNLAQTSTNSPDSISGVCFWF